MVHYNISAWKMQIGWLAFVARHAAYFAACWLFEYNG
jgi:hypothetical protein